MKTSDLRKKFTLDLSGAHAKIKVQALKTSIVDGRLRNIWKGTLFYDDGSSRPIYIDPRKIAMFRNGVLRNPDNIFAARMFFWNKSSEGLKEDVFNEAARSALWSFIKDVMQEHPEQWEFPHPHGLALQIDDCHRWFQTDAFPSDLVWAVAETGNWPEIFDKKGTFFTPKNSGNTSVSFRDREDMRAFRAAIRALRKEAA